VLRADPGAPDDREFDRFFVNHFDGLVRSLSLVTGDRELATDCVQEAFVRAFARWRRVRRADNPALWVRRVAINLSLDAGRTDTRRRRREDRVSASHNPVAPPPSDTIESDLGLVELLARLTPQQRAVAALFYVEDISIAEIAETLGLSAGAVKYHLNRARSSLQEALTMEEVRNG
jgi:RNA polymerase sigma-70 factor (ECF subfamily)